MPRLHALAWAVFVLCVVTCATGTAGAASRLLGGDVVAATPTPALSCYGNSRDAAIVDACAKEQAYQAYLATLRKSADRDSR
jgi:hypothetical protein